MAVNFEKAQKVISKHLNKTVHFMSDMRWVIIIIVVLIWMYRYSITTKHPEVHINWFNPLNWFSRSPPFSYYMW